MRISFLLCVAATVLALALCAVQCSAQSTNAAVGGRITDEQGRVVPGVTVVLTNLNTGVMYEAKTNGDGFYNSPNLPPGIYRANVTKDGFKNLVKGDIELHVQDVASINFQLQVGSVTETVTVEAGAHVINTTDAAVSTVVDQTYVKNMPLNGRSFQDLILLTPGAVTQSPQTNLSVGLGKTGEFSVNGQRTESNYYTVDGVSANVGVAAGNAMTNINGGSAPSGSLSAATSLGTTQALVSVDDLQEFRVQTSTYSAEYGRNPGGQFAFETKSGTNHLHGTAFDYLRNGALDAADWFNDYLGVKQAALRQNDFGGTLGGPVQIPRVYGGKDRTFFFVSYEGLRLVAPQAAEAIFVPDLCLRGMAASCTGTNTSAAPALQTVLKGFPLPSAGGITDPANGFAQFIGSWSNPSSLDSTSVRFDHAVSDKLRLFFRFADTGSDSRSRIPNRRAVDSTSNFTLRTYTVGATSALSNRFSNQLRLNYSSNETSVSSAIDSFGGNSPVDLLQLAGLRPTDSTNVGLIYSGYNVLVLQGHSTGRLEQWNVVDTGNVALGRHSVKFGMDYRRLTSFSHSPSSASYLFLRKSGVNANQGLFTDSNIADGYPLFVNFSLFAQDEWRASRRLNLSLGLRWDVNPATGAAQGIKPYTIQFQGAGPNTWTLAPQGTPLWRTSWYNFAPRLGAAYLLHESAGRQTVLRAGIGVFFDTGQQLGAGGFTDSPGMFANSPFCFTCPFPGSPLPFPAIVNPPVAPYIYVYGFAKHLQLPYTLQWNASVEQELGKSQALTLSYVASHASRLLRQSNYPATNPITGTFLVVENGLTSDYDSLQTQFRRYLAQGLTALASYTWSHCLDYGSQNYLLGYQRGDCDFDIRHSVSGAMSYDLPSVGNSRFTEAILHHWGLDARVIARTAFPVTLNGTTTVDPTTGRQINSGLNLVAGQPIYLYGSNCTAVLQGLGDLAPGKACPGDRAINPSAFVTVSSGFGNAPRNFTRGFGAWQANLAIRRDFPIHEALKLQFRAEAFNLFNHPNFGAVNSSFGQKTFGQATSTLANSLGVLSPLYQMGGPRSLQFALKFVF